MGALMRAKDWSKTPLGPVAQWSASLRTTTSLLLANRFPMLLWWGPDSISIYNDAYIPVLGRKHPDALGLPVRECWSEIDDVLRPLIETPLGGGPPTWSEDLQLDILRHGFLEETHWTVAYSPVPDETAPNGIGGVLATVHEITAQVLGDRRGALLRDLGAHMEARTAEEACAHAADVFGQYTKDIPFALIYLVDEDGRTARLARATGIAEDHPSRPKRISLTDGGEMPWAIATAVRTGTVHVVESAGSRLTCAPSRPPSDLPPRALVLPLETSLSGRPSGVVILGLSPLLALDGSYRGFADSIADRLGRAVANARAYEAERRRADCPAFREQRGIMYPAEEWDRLNALVEETLRRGADYEVELRAIRADGAEIWVNARGTPVRDATGAIVGLRGTTQDVTERRRAQDAMRESEARVYSLTNNLPESLVYQIVAGLDGTRRFTFLSEAVTKLFGCTPAEGIADATRIYGRFLAEDQARLALAEKQALTELSPFRSEARFHTVSGGIAWAYISSAPRRRADGSMVWDGILVDVTERRQTEEALRSSEERLQAHMDNSPLAVIEFDREFRVRRWSQQAERLFGWSAEEIVGRAIGELRSTAARADSDSAWHS